MKANSIDEIREHLAKGGRVVAHFVHQEGYEPEVNDVYSAASSGDGIVVNVTDQMWVKFADKRVDHWQLLPLEEKEPVIKLDNAQPMAGCSGWRQAVLKDQAR